MISTNDLYAFLITSEELNLTKAARRLGLSQPALSHCIKRIEIELSRELFIRRKSGLILNPSGELLKKKAQEIIKEVLSLNDSFVDIDKRIQKSIKLGVHPSVGQYVIPFLITEIKDIKFELNFGLSREVNTLVENGKLDCAIVVNPTKLANSVIHKIGTDEFNLFCHKTIKNTDCLIINSELFQTQHILKQFDKHKIKFKQIIEVPNLELVSRLIHQGVGAGIAPLKILNLTESNDITIYSNKIRPFLDSWTLVYNVELKNDPRIMKIKKTLLEMKF